MARYLIAHDEGNDYHVVKVTKGGDKAIIVPPVWRLVSRTEVEHSDDIVDLDDFEEVWKAHPNSAR